MGGLTCAKEIIDQRNAAVQAMDCMAASIQLNAIYKTPTYDQRDRFKSACDQVASIAAEIESDVRSHREESVDGKYDTDRKGVRS